MEAVGLARSFVASLASLAGFVGVVASLFLFYLGLAALSSGSLGGLALFAAAVFPAMGLFAVGNLVFLFGASLGSRLSRLLSLPMAVIDGLVALVLAVASLRALSGGEPGAAAVGAVLAVMVGLASYYLFKRFARG